MKLFKKYFSALVVAASLILSSRKGEAASTSVTIPSGTMTNLITLNNGSVKVTQIVLTSITTNAVNCYFIDTYTNWLAYTNAGYTNILTYVTNYVSVWTNYYGRTNTVTNSASLIDVAYTNAGTTNAFPIRMILSTPTNTSVRVDNVNYYFNDGIWVSNSASGNAQVTITYQQ